MVGAGIVGLATARTLQAKFPGEPVIVLEKGERPAAHQTGHNSGVIHAGIYYQPGSLKAELCRRGAVWTREFCDRHGIAYRNTGKLIVATDESERGRLDNLFERATANRIVVEKLGAADLAEREPRVNGVAAVFSPTTGIVDYVEICTALADELRDAGGELRCANEVIGLDERDGEVVVHVRDAEPVVAERVVVCAGLQADRLAALSGLADDFRIVPFRGEYYRLPDSRSGLVSTLIYPVPDPGLPFLGVHLTLTMDGGITVGPNAVLGFSREGYPKGSVNVADSLDYLRFPGFWRLARRYARTGVAEQYDSWVRAGYLRRVRRYCPELEVDDLLPHPAGIRAQALRRDGSMVEDFLFRRTDRVVHVCNAPSPAATSAMPIAEVIVAELSRS